MKSQLGKSPTSGWSPKYAAEHARIFGSRCNACPTRAECKRLGCQRSVGTPCEGERDGET